MSRPSPERLARCRHTPQPAGYVAWHEWAERKSRTHEQSRCAVCGLYAAWTRRAEATPPTLTPDDVRRLLDEGAEVRRDLEGRIAKMRKPPR